MSTRSYVGIIIHMALSMKFGVGLVWIGRGLPRQMDVRAVVLSLALWTVTNFIALPLVDQTFYNRSPTWIFAVGHVMYGIRLGGYLLSKRAHAAA